MGRIMRTLFIISLILTSLVSFPSFSVFAKDNLYDCKKLGWTLKVENPLFGDKKLFSRVKGSWKEICASKDTLQISEDSFRCSYSWNERTKEFTTATPKFYVFDEKFKTITFHYPSINMKKAYECVIQE